MKKYILLFITCLFPFIGNAHNDLDSSMKGYYVENKVGGNSKQVDDYTWLRRVYLDLAGRIPTQKEIDAYIAYQSPDKKIKMVEKLLYSEDYVNNMYNFWADLFRIRPERLSDNIGLLKSYPYMDYVRNFIRSDIPYNNFVKGLLTAKGDISNNPATGYMLRDTGMPLDNLATTLQIFIGKDIACAQCHDDPFQDYSQMQFYQMAAFFNTIELRESRKDYGDILKRIDKEITEITGKDRIDNNVRQLLSSNLFNVRDDDKKNIRLPHDYKYTDAKPNDVVSPVSLSGTVKNVQENKREAIASWIVSHKDFSPAIVNRIWATLVGKPLVSPEINFNLSDYPEGKVLQFLSDYFEKNNYSIKKLVLLIATSDFYSRVASIDSEQYKFQSPLVRRLSSYQVWDSILTLLIPDVNYSRISFSEYNKLIEINWESVTGQDLLKRMEDIRVYEKSLNDNILKYKGIELVRAAYVFNRNGFVGQFLREYGSSDRILIDSSDNKGSITQVLVLMNSPVSMVLSDKNSLLYTKTTDEIFRSILGRPATIDESSRLKNLSKEDLIWILINSKEFLFNK